MGTSRSRLVRHYGICLFFRAFALIVADPLDKRIMDMQRIVEAAITSPQLDTFPFGKGHIQAIIGTLLVLLSCRKRTFHH
jgi:hypothetical protein